MNRTSIVSADARRHGDMRHHNIGHGDMRHGGVALPGPSPSGTFAR